MREEENAVDRNQIRYEKGTPADRRAIAAFGSDVFSRSGDRTDFPTLLPKLYGEEVDLSECHYLARSGGALVGVVGAFPLEANIMGRPFKVCGIGTVCTHPEYRGKGIMRTLLRSALTDMRGNGAAFSVLGGRRQRYEHFGYEPCGTMIEFTATEENLRPFFDGARGLSIVPPERGDPEDVRRAHELQCGRPLSVTRPPELFLTTCRSWNSTPLLLRRGGEFCGYLVRSDDKKVLQELELSDGESLPEALAAYLAWSGQREVRFGLPPYEREKIAALEAFCESFRIGPAYSFLLFDWEGVLRQLFKLKAAYSPLADGRFVLEVRDCGRFLLEVRSQKTSVEKTSAPADVSLGRLDAMRFLFSPLSAFYSDAPGLGAFAASWFPLPLCWPHLDGI